MKEDKTLEIINKAIKNIKNHKKTQLFWYEHVYKDKKVSVSVDLVVELLNKIKESIFSTRPDNALVEALKEIRLIVEGVNHPILLDIARKINKALSTHKERTEDEKG